MCRFKKYLITSLLLAPLSIYAQDGALELSAGDEAKELTQLLELLQEQTSLATKSRLNADYVPGMITVLHGEEVSGR